jgi:hypothetical protein
LSLSHGLILFLGFLFLNLFLVEFVSNFLSSGSVSREDHNGENQDGEGKDTNLVVHVGLSVTNSKFKAGPPVETVENVEAKKSSNNDEDVIPGVLVDELVVILLGEEILASVLTVLGHKVCFATHIF